MPRKKHFTEKQNGLLSLTARVDVNLAQEERLLLGYIIKEYSTRSNFLKENGYVHASVRTIKKECGLGQDTIEQARIKLENEGLITCEVGKAGVQNTRFSLTEKTKKYIYVPESVPIDEKSVPESVPEEKKVHDEQNNRIESLELRISELTNAVEKLTEEVQNMKKYIGIGLVNPLFNSSCINKVNLKNSSSTNQNTIATGTGGLLPDDELFQDEPEEKTDVEMENEVKQKRTYTSMENNEYVDKCLNRFDVMLKYLYSIKDCKTYDSYTNDILRFWESIDQSRFTEKQRGLIDKKCERWAKISDAKERFFNGNAGKSDDESISIEPECEEYADAEHISMDEETNLNAGTEENGDSQSQCEDAPNPRRQTKTSDEISEWVLKQCKRFPDYASWEKDFEKKIVKKYTSDWANNAEAGRYYNFCTGIAWKYFKEKVTDDDAGIDYLLKASEEEIAPWEEESKPVQMKQEDWHSKYGHLIKH